MGIKERYKKRISIEEIKALKYQGYYWYSDKSSPTTLDKALFKADLISPDGTFIVEAHLYNQEEELSYSIKYIDGEHWIAEINLKGITQLKDYIDRKEYFTHDIEKYKKYIMIEAWIEAPLYPNYIKCQTDEKQQIPNIQTLVPAWSAFAGFKVGE